MSDSGKKEILNELLEDYKKAKAFLEETDPENQPYRSKYAAKVILEKILAKLHSIQNGEGHSENENDQQDIFGTDSIRNITAHVELMIGVIDLDTEEPTSAEQHLNTCVQILKNTELGPGNVLALVGAYNRLGILWSDRGEIELAKDLLIKAEDKYKNYKENVKSRPKDILDLLHSEAGDAQEDCFEKLEKKHAHTLFYLGQVYQALNDSAKSASYFQATLRKQIEWTDCDHIDWAINAATLSQFYLSQDKYVEARHLLACANKMVDKYEGQLQPDSEDFSEKMETLSCCKADVARCWVKYSVTLLTASKDNLMNKSQDELVSEVSKMNVQAGDPSDIFIPRTVLDASALEDEITAAHVMDFQEARPVFLYGQRRVADSVKFYSKENHASDYVEIVQDHSKLYQLLAFFEPVPDRQCKMLKRRADMLEEIVKELNQQYFLALSRQLQFELAEIYSDMRDIKTSMVEEGEREMTVQNAKKINSLTNNSIKYYDAFLNSFKDDVRKELPKEYPADSLRPVLLSQFCSGRLFSKLITEDTAAQVQNLEKCLARYQFVIDYCKKHNEAAEVMKPELGVCTEMASLIPLKIQQIILQT